MRVRPPLREEPVYGILKRTLGRYDDWVKALGRDYLELESDEPWQAQFGRAYVVETRRIDPAALLRLCPLIARDDPKLSEFGAFMEAVQGAGIAIPASKVIVCGEADLADLSGSRGPDQAEVS